MDAPASVRADPELSVKLASVDPYVNDTHLPRIRLFFQLLGLGGGAVETETSLVKFYSILKTSPAHKPRALELIQYILTFVGVRESKIVELDETALEHCKKVLAYPSAVVGVCSQVTDEEFRKIKELGSEKLKCDPDNIKSMEWLCLKLHHLASISSGDVDLLAQWLEMDSIGRVDLSNRLMDYARFGVYEDPVISGALGDGRFPQKPVQATERDQNKPSSRTMVSFSIAKGATSDVIVERDASQLQGKSSTQGDQHLQAVPPASSETLTRVTSFSKDMNAATSSEPPSSVVDKGGYDRQTSGSSSCSSSDNVKETTNLLDQGTCMEMKPQSSPDNSSQANPQRPLCKYLSISVAVVGVIVTVVFAVVALFFCLYGTPYLRTCRKVYATEEQTVIVAQISDPLKLRDSSIHECPSPDDFPHTNKLYIIPTHQLQPERRHISKNFPDVQNQTNPYCLLNFLDDHLYLLKDSMIDFRICLTADTDPVRPGTLLIFDSNAAYSKFVSNKNCRSREGVVSTHNLNIGSYGQYLCTNVTYTSEANGYHYIVADTPGNIKFYYRYSYFQYYLNPDDFSQPPSCVFSHDSDNQCNLGGISKSPVYLVVSVEKSEFDNSPSTHVCLTSSGWSIRTILLVLLFGLGCVCVFGLSVFCICFLCIRHCCNH